MDLTLSSHLRSLLAFIGRPTNVAYEFGSFGPEGWLHWTSAEQWAILYAQNIMLFVFVWYLACISGTFMHRTLSVRKYIPFRNRVWVAAVIFRFVYRFDIVLQFVFCVLSLFSGPYSFSRLPWYVYLLALIWPIVFLPVQELAKMHDNKEYTRFQKRSKLEFSTKLGMHSPL
ncbi:hypothetical protein BC937DRAFT_89258 [Endogone sp. FLAS-F59071]|nr:hypothetical protein BC937DRAFT_89258 [Endogone sp. FLAS-F59071]|eukprot:RUS17997.1 hypothetical protein BC937DRAFT_89258 [Endogone sp. FLAS-F59071]